MYGSIPPGLAPTSTNEVHSALDERLGYEIISEWTVWTTVWTATSARHYLRSVIGSKEFANCPR